MTDTRTLVPTLDGPIPSGADSHQFNSTLTYDVPLDLARFGFVEQEFFVTGRAALYAPPWPDAVSWPEPDRSRCLCGLDQA